LRSLILNANQNPATLKTARRTTTPTEIPVTAVAESVWSVTPTLGSGIDIDIKVHCGRPTANYWLLRFGKSILFFIAAAEAGWWVSGG
jgi:hypothetical protein